MEEKNNGRHLTWKYNKYVIDIFQPDCNKPGLSICIKGHFKAQGNVDYNKGVYLLQSKIKSVTESKLVVIDYPDIIFIDKLQRFSIDIYLLYTSTIKIKQNFIWIGETKSMINEIIDNFIEQLFK